METKQTVKTENGDKYIVSLNIPSYWPIPDDAYIKKQKKMVKKFLDSGDTVIVFPYPATITKIT